MKIAVTLANFDEEVEYLYVDETDDLEDIYPILHLKYGSQGWLAFDVVS